MDYNIAMAPDIKQMYLSMLLVRCYNIGKKFSIYTSFYMKKETSEKFSEVYENESDAIFRFCLVRVSNREQALDITQETFLRLWQSLRGNKEIQNNRAFLFTIANHLIIDWYRKKKSMSLEGMMYRDGELEYDPVDESTVDGLGLEAEGRYLLRAISKLAPNHKDPVYLRFVEDLTPGEIGKILWISANAASVRITRGLEELRKNTGYDDIDKTNSEEKK